MNKKTLLTLALWVQLLFAWCTKISKKELVETLSDWNKDMIENTDPFAKSLDNHADKIKHEINISEYRKNIPKLDLVEDLPSVDDNVSLLAWENWLVVQRWKYRFSKKNPTAGMSKNPNFIDNLTYITEYNSFKNTKMLQFFRENWSISGESIPEEVVNLMDWADD